MIGVLISWVSTIAPIRAVVVPVAVVNATWSPSDQPRSAAVSFLTAIWPSARVSREPATVSTATLRVKAAGVIPTTMVGLSGEAVSPGPAAMAGP